MLRTSAFSLRVLPRVSQCFGPRHAQSQAFAADFHVSLALHDGEHLYESKEDYAEAPAAYLHTDVCSVVVRSGTGEQGQG